MILMNAGIDLSGPPRTSPDLVLTPVTFDDQEIARAEPATFQFAVEHLEQQNFRQVQPSTLNVRNPKVRDWMFVGSSLPRLLYSSGDGE